MSDETTYIRYALAAMLREIGYTSGGASQIAKGKRKPSLAMAAEIERRLKIPASCWASGVPLKETLAIMQRSIK